MIRVIITLISLYTCLFYLKKKFVLGLTEDQKYTVTLIPSEAMLNEGESLKARCSIPGLSAMDIILKNLKIRWYHNEKLLPTHFCQFKNPETMNKKYDCNIVHQQQNNISFEFTIKDVLKKDSGNLTCEVLKQEKQHGKLIGEKLIAKEVVVIKVREPITTMYFNFDQSLNETLTLDNNATPHRIEVDAGMYSPNCEVKGSTPQAEVIIMLGDDTIKGKTINMPEERGMKFIADKMEFKGNTESSLTCRSSVSGLLGEVERTFYIVVHANCSHCQDRKNCSNGNESCLEPCEEGRDGHFCGRDAKLSKLSLVVISAISTVLVVFLIIAIIIIVYNRKRTRQQNTREPITIDALSNKDTQQKYEALAVKKEENTYTSLGGLGEETGRRVENQCTSTGGRRKKSGRRERQRDTSIGIMREESGRKVENQYTSIGARRANGSGRGEKNQYTSIGGRENESERIWENQYTYIEGRREESVRREEKQYTFIGGRRKETGHRGKNQYTHQLAAASTTYQEKHTYENAEFI
ncbi:uncharacterized protein LOC134281786 [Saccostrea cucullata]|uniref:uncharacterized protein LOC134281786 n=1 Tax=Saccostrea cuccullata TaxID=36930 RepID=UPI002ED59F72